MTRTVPLGHTARMRRAASLLVFAVLACGACGPPLYPLPVAHSLLSKPLPQLRRLQGLDGRAIDEKELLGKPVVVKFFAQYCVPCMATIPEAERVHQANKDVFFLGVDEDENAENARAFVTRMGITFPVVHDASKVLAGRFRVGSMPVTFVADRQGTLRWIGGEGQTGDDLDRAVAAALASPTSQ